MQAFVISFVITTALTFAAIPYGKRRPVGKPLTWGEAMAAATYVFFVMFLAYGVVPHQWLTHVQNELGWRADKILSRPRRHLQVPGPRRLVPVRHQLPADRRHPRPRHLRLLRRPADLHVVAGGRSAARQESTEVETSTYGRPLVKKA